MFLHHVWSWCHPSRACSVFTHATGWESLTAADEFLRVTHQKHDSIMRGCHEPFRLFPDPLTFHVFPSLLADLCHDRRFHLRFVMRSSRALCCVNVLRMCSCSDSKQDFNNPDFITMYTLKFPCVSWWVLWIMSMNMSMLTLSDYDWLDTCIPSHPLQLPFFTEGSIASPNPSLHPLLGCFVFLLLRSFMIHGGSMPNPFFLLFP